MNEGQSANSGELSSFLHLTGWRPLLLALVAGLAGAYGLFLALDAPAQWQARYVLNASRIADDDLSPQELDIFVEEIAQTARFPQVERAVEERLGLINEEDYEIVVNQSGASAQFVDINVVSENPTEAQAVAIETGIEAMTITLSDILGGHEAAAGQIQGVIDEDELRIAELTADAGGFTPTVAYQIAIDNVVQRRLDEANPPQVPCLLDDGTPATCDEEYNGPSLEELEAEVARLAPVEREFVRLDGNIQAASERLAIRTDSIRDTEAALVSVENERENQLILDEVVTEETSRIAGLLTGLLLFAIPAALIMIVLFTVYDLLRRTPEVEFDSRETFDAAGAIDVTHRSALAEASVTSLTVVDEEDDYPHEDDGDVLGEDSDDGDDGEPESPKEPRWGRSAGGKAV